MDNEDRSERCLPSYPGTCQHQEILQIWVAGTVYQFRVLPFGLSTAPREFTKTLAPVVHLLRSRGIQVHAYLDDWIIRASTKELSLLHTQQVLQLLQSLGWTINWDKSMLQPTRILGLSGPPFQFRTSPDISSGLVFTYSHRSPLPSISVDSHVCSQGFIYYQQAVPFCPIYNPWTSPSTFPPTLVQGPMDSTSSVMGHSSQARFGVPIIPPLVPSSLRDDGCPVTSAGPQSLLLHRCISQGLGSQLADTTAFRSLVPTRIQTPHQLAGIRSHSSGPTSLGPTMESSDSPGILRQQYRGGVHSETRRNSFQSSVSQDSRTLPITGSVPDNSHTHTSSRRQECHRRCSVSSQSAQPNGMASSTSNLKQTVLCLGDSLIDMFATAENKVTPIFVSPYPDDRAWAVDALSLSWDDLGLNLRLSPGSHSAQNDPEDTEIPRHHGHSDSISTPITTVASSIAPVEHASQDPPDRRSTIPVCTNIRRPQFHRDPTLLDLAAWLLSGIS